MTRRKKSSVSLSQYLVIAAVVSATTACSDEQGLSSYTGSASGAVRSSYSSRDECAKYWDVDECEEQKVASSGGGAAVTRFLSPMYDPVAGIYRHPSGANRPLPSRFLAGGTSAKSITTLVSSARSSSWVGGGHIGKGGSAHGSSHGSSGGG